MGTTGTQAVIRFQVPARKYEGRIWNTLGFPRGASGKEPACQCRRQKRREFDPWVRKIPRRRAWQPTPVFLPGESHGQRNLVGYSPQGRKESDTTEATWHTHMHSNNKTSWKSFHSSPTNLLYSLYLRLDIYIYSVEYINFEIQIYLFTIHCQSQIISDEPLSQTVLQEHPCTFFFVCSQIPRNELLG